MISELLVRRASNQRFKAENGRVSLDIRFSFFELFREVNSLLVAGLDNFASEEAAESPTSALSHLGPRVVEHSKDQLFNLGRVNLVQEKVSEENSL